MLKVTEQAVCKNVSNLKFNFSNTKRGENITLDVLPGDYIIDLSGNIFQKNAASDTATITVIGGIDEHAYKKDKIKGEQFYMTPEQKIAISKILKWFAILKKFDGKIEAGNNYDLYAVAEGMFHNFRS